MIMCYRERPLTGLTRSAGDLVSPKATSRRPPTATASGAASTSFRPARNRGHHYHTANEEAIYVLSGSATLRHDGETVRIEAGDYVAFPADESGAHRVVNEGDDSARYRDVDDDRAGT